MIIKMISKLLAIPALLVISLVWLVVKAMTAIYGVCYGILGLGLVAAFLLFLFYQEWMNVVAVIVIAVVAFAILFSGSFIQVLLEVASSGLRRIIRA